MSEAVWVACEACLKLQLMKLTWLFTLDGEALYSAQNGRVNDDSQQNEHALDSKLPEW